MSRPPIRRSHSGLRAEPMDRRLGGPPRKASSALLACSAVCHPGRVRVHRPGPVGAPGPWPDVPLGRAADGRNWSDRALPVPVSAPAEVQLELMVPVAGPVIMTRSWNLTARRFALSGSADGRLTEQGRNRGSAPYRVPRASKPSLAIDRAYHCPRARSRWSSRARLAFRRAHR